MGCLSWPCTFRGRQLEFSPGLCHIIFSLCFSSYFKFRTGFVDDLMQELPTHAALSSDITCLMQDLRTNNSGLSRTLSISSKQSDTERHVRFAEPAYSFVGMHCIFDSCKTSGYFLWPCYAFFFFQWPGVLIWLIWAEFSFRNVFALGSYNIEIWPRKFWSACVWCGRWQPNCLPGFWATICSSKIDRSL